MTLRVFPVGSSSPRPQFASTFGAPRSGGRTHEGVDIFAPEGTEVRAVDSGQVRHATAKLGGLVAHLMADDGTYYYFAHLSEWVGPSPRRVKAGDVIGLVGRTGNARDTPPHLHFEIHPGNGRAVDPFNELVAIAAPGSVVITEPGPSSSTRAVAGAGAGVLLFLLALALSRR